MTSAFPLPGLSILLPCFNEVDNVREAIVQARSAAQRVASRHEIVVVDDGSTDGTGAIARPLAARFSGGRVVTHKQNRGYGPPLRTCIQAGRTPWVVLTD